MQTITRFYEIMIQMCFAARPSLFAVFRGKNAKRVGLPGSLLVVSALFLAAFPAAAQTPPASSARFVVVLDAAHGGDDPGGRINDPAGHAQPEKALTLALSGRLRSLLAARGIPVVTTRDADSAVAPDRRAEIANHANAQACLSLHAAQTGSGVHLFVSSLPPSDPARFVPWKTAQAAWVTRSLALAGALNSALLHASVLVTLDRTALPAIDSMACPAVAVEIAPEIVPNHTAAPGDAAYQSRVANALAAALVAWRAEVRQP
jgi:N-acetylmuramoyl-L-alanine amidase